MWKLSKCIHIEGDGLVSLPLAKVSAASRWLNSSWMSGSGTGMSGKSRRRTTRAVAPTVSTASARRRARPPSARSAASNHVEPSPGRTRATTTARRAGRLRAPRLAGILRNTTRVGPLGARGDEAIPGTGSAIGSSAEPRRSTRHAREHGLSEVADEHLDEPVEHEDGGQGHHAQQEQAERPRGPRDASRLSLSADDSSSGGW